MTNSGWDSVYNSFGRTSYSLCSCWIIEEEEESGRENRCIVLLEDIFNLLEVWNGREYFNNVDCILFMTLFVFVSLKLLVSLFVDRLNFEVLVNNWVLGDGLPLKLNASI